MRLEIRSDGIGCPHCGATELITTQDGDALTASWEVEYREMLEELRAATRSELEALLVSIDEERAVFVAAVEGYRRRTDSAIREALDLVAGPEPAWWRPIRRRHRKRFLAEVEPVKQGLFQATVRA